MELTAVENVVITKQKGSFGHIAWAKTLPTKKGVEGVVVKRTRAVSRFGVEYDNIKAVQEKRLTGELPGSNAGLPWGTWRKYPYFIENKGKDYLRVYTVNGSKHETNYYLDGNEISADKAKELCLKSAFSENKVTDCFTVAIENISEIN